MGEQASAEAAQERVIEAYGARVSLSAPDADVLERLIAALPPGWAPSPGDGDSSATAWRIAVTPGDEGYVIREETVGGEWSEDSPPPESEESCRDLDVAVALIRERLRRHVGHHARGYLFVHAGVVGHHGRAIVIPGRSFSGKSTLVAALVRAGASFYSDEYAVLDEDGRAHPYLEPPSLRQGRRRGIEVTVESLGGVRGKRALPVGLVVVTSYVDGVDWSPRRKSTGEGIVALLEHAIPARERPEEALEIARRAAEDAIVLEGERGEAESAATALVEAIAATDG